MSPGDQLGLALEEGLEAAQACTDKAEAVTEFDSEACCRLIVAALRREERTSSELVDMCIEAGQKPHDQRAFGSVFLKLQRRGEIVMVRAGIRSPKSHGSMSGKLWRVGP